MFARVQTFHHPAEKLDELTLLIREQLKASPPAGLDGFSFLIDRDHGKALLISLWESEEALRHLEASNASTRAQVEADTGVEPPPTEVFEVVLQAP